MQLNMITITKAQKIMIKITISWKLITIDYSYDSDYPSPTAHVATADKTKVVPVI